MFRSPVTRISFGLVLLTLSVLVLGDFFGLVPNPRAAVVEGRKKFCETLAVQMSTVAATGDRDSVLKVMHAVVKRNPDVNSTALRGADGNLVVETEGHTGRWEGAHPTKSTPTHARVPIYNKDELWGTVEVSFGGTGDDGWASLTSPFFKMLLFVAVASYAAYHFFMRKILKHLDPTAVVPSRVKRTLDALAEGVVLLDDRRQIVLANSQFCEHVGASEENVVGQDLSQLEFSTAPRVADGTTPPWELAMEGNTPRTRDSVYFRDENDKLRTMMVNCTPIGEANGKVRGVLVTFDDVTDIEHKNLQLKTMVSVLEKSRDDVKNKNRELEFLATRDPLTGCLNRRAFFAKYDSEFARAQSHNEDFACVMLDIDHFKAVNDSYGHGTGDQVIQKIAEVVQSNLRENEMVCRYGGEEFCIVLQRIAFPRVLEIAERIRAAIAAVDNFDFSVSASLGASALEFGSADLEDLIDEADKALYVSKEGGRNRVTSWADMEKTFEHIVILP